MTAFFMERVMGRESLRGQVAVSKVIAIIAIGVAAYVYWSHFGWSLEKFAEPDAWGQMGDFFGGILNPLLAFGAFYWVATSVNLQKEELTETRNALIDASNAQQQQADTNLLAAQIQTLNVKLTRLGSELDHLRDREVRVMDHIGTKGAGSLYWAPDGTMSSGKAVLTDIQEKIEFLEKKECELLGKVDEIQGKFRTKTATSYHNG